MHASLEYYLNNYKGSMFTDTDVDMFTYFAQKASTQIDLYTFGRIANVTNDTSKVKNCCCELVEYLKTQQDLENSDISSESLGNRSVTYKSAKAKAEKNSDIRNIIVSNLANSGLLYMGMKK